MRAGYPHPHFVLDMNLLLNAKYKSSYIRSTNKPPLEKRAQILSMFCEGSSMRATSRVADVSINIVSKLLLDAGLACALFHDEAVRGVEAKHIQCDEI